MSKKITLIIVLIILSIAVLGNNVFAGDYLYHLMHGHQDYLMVATITKIDGEKYSFETNEVFVENSIRDDFPKEFEVKTGIVMQTYNVGDVVLISFNKSGWGYALNNGMYKITSNNTDTAIVAEDLFIDEKEKVVIEIFMKSRGAIKDFYFTEKEVYIYNPKNPMSDDSVLVYSEENGKMIPNDLIKNNKMILENKTDLFDNILIIIIILAVGATTYYLVRKYEITNEIKIAKVELEDKLDDLKEGLSHVKDSQVVAKTKEIIDEKIIKKSKEVINKIKEKSSK